MTAGSRAFAPRTVGFLDALAAIPALQNTLILTEGTAEDATAMRAVSAVSSVFSMPGGYHFVCFTGACGKTCMRTIAKFIRRKIVEKSLWKMHKFQLY